MRLEPLRPDELTEEQDALLEAMIGKAMGKGEVPVDENGFVRGPVVVSLHHPETGRPLQELATALRFEGELSDQAREVVILVVAFDWMDEHEIAAHEPLALNCGVTPEQLDALETGAPVEFADPVTQAACDAARAIVSRRDLTDAEHAAAAAVLTQRQMIELVMVIGYYDTISRALRVFQVPGRKRVPR